MRNMNTEEENEFDEKSYKNGRKIGIWTGIVGTLAVLTVAMLVYTFVKKDNPYKALSESPFADRLYKINQIYTDIDKAFLYEVDYDKVTDEMFKALAGALDDNYSEYYSVEEAKAESERLGGYFYGVGVSVVVDTEKGGLEIVDFAKTSGARDAGLLTGDIIVEVEGTPFTEENAEEFSLLLRGEEEGSVVKVKVKRGNELLDFELKRCKVDTQTVSFGMIKEQPIGYIYLSHFEDSAVEQFKEAYRNLKEKGAQKLIIDLRNNGGGAMQSALQILDYLLPEGIVVYTQDKYGYRKNYFSSADEAALDIPCAVLVNENTASASELFTAALVDFDKAIVVGKNTFGKGIVQTLFGLEDGSIFKITTEEYYSPKGQRIHKKGITPDYEVERDIDKLNNEGIDTQVEKAIEALNK